MGGFGFDASKVNKYYTFSYLHHLTVLLLFLVSIHNFCGFYLYLDFLESSYILYLSDLDPSLILYRCICKLSAEPKCREGWSRYNSTWMGSTSIRAPRRIRFEKTLAVETENFQSKLALILVYSAGSVDSSVFGYLQFSS